MFGQDHLGYRVDDQGRETYLVVYDNFIKSRED